MDNKKFLTVIANQGGAVPWYQAGGAPAPWGAWLFKGAADEATSLLDLVNSNNLTKTGAPVWDANGWQGNNSGYLQVNFDTNTASSTAIFRFAGIDDTFEGLWGHHDGTNNFYARCAGSGNIQALQGNTGEYIAAFATNAVYAISGHRLYRDGVAVGAAPWAGTDGVISTQDFFILAYNSNGTPSFPMDAGDYCIGGALYTSNLTAAQILAVSQALAAL